MPYASALLLGAVLLGAVSTSAMPGGRIDPLSGFSCPAVPLIGFETMDGDGDGSIDRAEFEAVFDPDDDQGAFEVFDTDSSGFISREEFDAIDIEVEPVQPDGTT